MKKRTLATVCFLWLPVSIFADLSEFAGHYTKKEGTIDISGGGNVLVLQYTDTGRCYRTEARLIPTEDANWYRLKGRQISFYPGSPVAPDTMDIDEAFGFDKTSDGKIRTTAYTWSLDGFDKPASNQGGPRRKNPPGGELPGSLVPPKRVADKLSPDWNKRQEGAFEKMKEFATKESANTVVSQAIEFVVGKTASKVFDAINPEMAADGTLTSKVQYWRDRCGSYVADYNKRVDAAEFAIEEQKQIVARLKQHISYAEAAQLQQKKLILSRYASQELTNLKFQIDAVQWCQGFKSQATTFLNASSTEQTTRVRP